MRLKNEKPRERDCQIENSIDPDEIHERLCKGHVGKYHKKLAKKLGKRDGNERGREKDSRLSGRLSMPGVSAAAAHLLS